MCWTGSRHQALNSNMQIKHQTETDDGNLPFVKNKDRIISKTVLCFQMHALSNVIVKAITRLEKDFDLSSDSIFRSLIILGCMISHLEALVM